MGCNSSKREDIKTDRTRVNRQSQEPHFTRSPARGIAVPQSGKQVSEEPGADGYGTSYTKRKTKEYDFLHNIVNQTRENFIDVSQRPVALDATDALERSERYQQLSEAALSKSPMTSLFALPHTSSSSALDVSSIASLLSSVTIAPQDVEFVTSVAQNLSTAIQSMDVKDVGKVVLTFDELPLP